MGNDVTNSSSSSPAAELNLQLAAALIEQLTRRVDALEREVAHLRELLGAAR